jgi:hypothetical protein
MPIKKVAHRAKMAKKGTKNLTLKWVPSSFDDADPKKAEKEGFLLEAAPIIFPSDESVLKPPKGYRVMFLAFLLRGLSLPAHEFLRGLLFVMACNCISSRQIRFFTLPALSLCVSLSLELTHTGFFGNSFFASAPAFL